MSTFTVVEEIKLKAPNWSRDGARSILAMMNRAQNFLFSKPSVVANYVDPATGDYPILATTAGVLDYEIPNVLRTLDDDIGPQELRIHQVHKLFTCASMINDYGTRALGVIDPNIVSTIRGTTSWRFTPIAATEIKKARIIFPFDPGTTTDVYKILAVIEPLQLLSDSIPLMVQMDDEEFIIEGALGWIEYYDYGRSDRLDKFRQEFAREFWNKYKGIESIRKANGIPRRKF